MPDRFAGTVFTEVHHALLFGWIGRAVIEAVGEGDMRIAVRLYGQERGRRMALRARAVGQALSLAAYFAYGEWKASPPEALPEGRSGWTGSQQWIEKTSQIARERVTRCPWHAAWKAHNLLPYGRLYCQEIDGALVGGFNPALAVDVLATLTGGAPACEFVFHDTGPATAQEPAAPGVPGQRTQMPWEYHAGHLFATLEKVLVARLGGAGRAAVEAGLAEFARHFGAPAAGRVLAYRGMDFNQLPD